MNSIYDELIGKYIQIVFFLKKKFKLEIVKCGVCAC